jgi:3D (Asp-Asp-Asp) domain-containing protein
MQKLKKLRKNLNRWLIFSITINLLILSGFMKMSLLIYQAKSQPEYLVADTIICPRLSAYNSEVGQCDADPWITASGLNLKEHWTEDVIATNTLPLKTRVRIPEYYGDKIFVVEDRMNKRYKKSADIWMKKRKEALKFGVKKNTNIEVLKKNPDYDTTNFWLNLEKESFFSIAKEIAKN